MRLVEWEYYREAVEGIVDQVYSLKALASQIHVKSELAELSEHEVLIGSLLEEHRLQDGVVCQDCGNPNEEVSCLLMFAKDLEQLDHHERKADQASRCVKSL